ncbi:hypothetical protein FNF31_06683 [Cafeteria roenbergensis]|uniref:HEAT repeat-containing protein 1 n=2 Tax=Cafeteria roenbergensis TaxID=33653 RepID=A0A5A8CGQ7_CAFRO|nr:hypothetical protein FNF31_06683 [Cafeteria roenbergensis]
MRASIRQAEEMLDTEALPRVALAIMAGHGKASSPHLASVSEEQDSAARHMAAVLVKRFVDVQDEALPGDLLEAIADGATACLADPRAPADVRRQAASNLSALVRKLGLDRCVRVVEALVAAIRGAAARVSGGSPEGMSALSGALAAAEMICDDSADQMDRDAPREAAPGSSERRVHAAVEGLCEALLACASHPSAAVHLPAARSLAHLCAFLPPALARRAPALLDALERLAAAVNLRPDAAADAAARRRH